MASNAPQGPRGRRGEQVAGKSLLGEKGGGGDKVPAMHSPGLPSSAENPQTPRFSGEFVALKAQNEIKIPIIISILNFPKGNGTSVLSNTQFS